METGARIDYKKLRELNPVRAKIITRPEEYSYSSYNYYAKGVKNKLITEDFFYQGLAENKLERQNEYQYTKPVWGAKEQRYNEARKIKYHLNKKL